jgi:hypothetical protein
MMELAIMARVVAGMTHPHATEAFLYDELIRKNAS